MCMSNACHLHLMLCTWDAVTTCTPLTVFFIFGVQLGSKNKLKYIMSTPSWHYSYIVSLPYVVVEMCSERIPDPIN